MKKTTWQGRLFLASWVFIIAAAILYNISEYTSNPHKGQVQENWAIVLFVIGIGSLIGSLMGASGE